MKKLSELLFGIVAVVGTCCAGLLWCNNLVSAWRFYQGLAAGRGDAASGFWPALDWSTLDVSTISTFIPFFGGVLLVRGWWRLVRRRPVGGEDFPFFPSYDRLNVALGLLGTIWGIILIGFHPPEVLSDGIGVLMQCLHTAMFSTLVAVLWVMVVLPLTFAPWLRHLRGDAADESGAGWDTLLTRFTDQVTGVGDALEQSGRQLAEFHAALSASGREMAQQAAYHERFGALLAELTRAQLALHTQLERVLKENQELRASRETLEKRLNESEAFAQRRIRTLENDLTQSVNHVARLKQMLEKIRTDATTDPM